jgi:hypothetical protein
LHCSVSVPNGLCDDMVRESTAHASTDNLWRDHEAGVGDVGSARRLIRVQLGRAKHIAVLLGDECRPSGFPVHHSRAASSEVSTGQQYVSPAATTARTIGQIAGQSSATASRIRMAATSSGCIPLE